VREEDIPIGLRVAGYLCGSVLVTEIDQNSSPVFYLIDSMIFIKTCD
jgi:hypothetical protein